MSFMWAWWCNSSSEKCQNVTAIVTSLVVAFAAVIWFTKKSRKASAPPLPPGPRGLPFVGYLPFLGTDFHKTFTELAAVYGPIYKFWLANKLWVVVSSASLAKEVVRDKDMVFGNREATVAGRIPTFGGNDIVWCPIGAPWRKLRKILVGEMMTNSSLDSCSDLRKQELKNTLRDLYGNKIGMPVNIGELAASTSINALQNMLWGGAHDMGEKGINIHAEVKQMLGEIMDLQGIPNISDIFPVLSRFDIQGVERKSKKIALWFENFFSSVIEKRKNLMAKGSLNFDGGKDYLQSFLELLDNEDSSKSINKTQLMALLMDIILGGTDTTTTILEWTMTMLLQHPEKMKKVQEELAEIVGMNKIVEESHLPRLKYLDATVKETFRLHPPSKLLPPRTPSQTTTIGGYTIPKGASVILNIGAIQTDLQLWKNPLEFEPDRFLNDPDKFDYTGNNFNYMPFGSGRRICAGLPLAERLVMLVLASLLHSFDWKLPYGENLDLSDKYGLVVKKKKPLILVPTPRLADERYK